jgi:1,4-dihydroxy-2-naphthoate octaprenyltransferase
MSNSLKKRLFEHLYSILVISCTFALVQKKTTFLLFLCVVFVNLQEKFHKHVNYEEDKNKVPMNKPYNIQNTNICNGIFRISFFKALLINEGEKTRCERE